MISLIVIPDGNRVVIEVPPDYAGKRLRVDVRLETDGQVSEYQFSEPDPARVKDVDEAFKPYQRDLGGRHYRRNETNER